MKPRPSTTPTAEFKPLAIAALIWPTRPDKPVPWDLYERAVLQGLCRLTDGETGWTLPPGAEKWGMGPASYGAIARTSGVSRSKAERAVRVLLLAGVVEMTSGKRLDRSAKQEQNQYRLLPDRLAEWIGQTRPAAWDELLADLRHAAPTKGREGSRQGKGRRRQASPCSPRDTPPVVPGTTPLSSPGLRSDLLGSGDPDSAPPSRAGGDAAAPRSSVGHGGEIELWSAADLLRASRDRALAGAEEPEPGGEPPRGSAAGESTAPRSGAVDASPPGLGSSGDGAERRGGPGAEGCTGHSPRPAAIRSQAGPSAGGRAALPDVGAAGGSTWWPTATIGTQDPGEAEPTETTPGRAASPSATPAAPAQPIARTAAELLDPEIHPTRRDHAREEDTAMWENMARKAAERRAEVERARRQERDRERAEREAAETLSRPGGREAAEQVRRMIVACDLRLPSWAHLLEYAARLIGRLGPRACPVALPLEPPVIALIAERLTASYPVKLTQVKLAGVLLGNRRGQRNTRTTIRRGELVTRPILQQARRLRIRRAGPGLAKGRNHLQHSERAHAS